MFVLLQFPNSELNFGFACTKESFAAEAGELLLFKTGLKSV